MARVVAAAIDVAAVQSAVFVVRHAVRRRAVHVVGHGVLRVCRGLPIDGVPLQALCLVVLIDPALWLNLQTAEVQHEAVVSVATALCLRPHDAAFVAGVVEAGLYVGVVAAAHHLIIYIQGHAQVGSVRAGVGHAAHVAAQEERAYPRRVGYVGGGVATSLLAVEDHARYEVHGAALHVGGEGAGVGQVDAAVVRNGRVVLVGHRDVVGCLHFVGSHLLQDVVRHHVLAVVAEEDVVRYDVGADLQLHHGVGFRGGERRAVAAHIDRAAYDDLLLHRAVAVGLSGNTQRHLFGVGACQVEGFYRAVCY